MRRAHLDQLSLARGTAVRRAFTFIEMAVVIILITILALILLPALEDAQTRSRRFRCLSRERQVGTAMSLFQTDHDRWPSARRSVTPGRPQRPDPTASLAELYPDYVSKVEMFQCPSTEDEVLMNAEGTDFLNCDRFEERGAPRPPSYFYDGGRPAGRRLLRTASPLRPVYGDECAHGVWTSPAGARMWMGRNNHAEGGHFLFVDLHVEWLPQEWDGLPGVLGQGTPYVPNPHVKKMGAAASERYGVEADTNIFTSHTGEPAHPLDADLAGMMWLGGSWQEF